MELTINQALQKAIEAHKAGELQTAEKLYTAIIKAQPEHPYANHNMGVLTVSFGKELEALPFFETALQSSITVEQFFLSYIDALIGLNRKKAAKSVLLQAKYNGLKGGAFDALEKRLYDTQKNVIGVVQNGDPPQNQLQPLIDLYNQGQSQKVLNKSKILLQSFPNSLFLYNIQGASHAELKQFEIAIANYQQALNINSDVAGIHFNIGNAHDQLKEETAAIMSYEQAIKIKPQYAEAYYNLGVLHKKNNDIEAALRSYELAIEIKPDYTEAYNNMGNLLRDIGKFTEAQKSLEQAIWLNPESAQAYFTLSTVKRFRSGDKQVSEMERFCEVEEIMDDERCLLCFALGKAYEDLNNLTKSFDFLRRGNILRKKLLRYEIGKDIALFKSLKNSQISIMKNSLKISEVVLATKPIFIVGMPRSGTTLIEQIVSCHPAVTGAGELSFVEEFGINLATGISRGSKIEIENFRKRYLLKLKSRSKGKAFVVDKLPHNFLYIGLICSAFPEAKIIHVKRDPAATCWSNYKNYFESEGLGYCYDLGDLVSYYSLYQDLMKVWTEVYGNHIYHLNYDTLTLNQEKESRRLVKYLELDWQTEFLFPELNKRSVSTVSGLQVRRKVYQKSSQQWRKFLPFIGQKLDQF